MEWKILGRVLFRVFATVLGGAAAGILIAAIFVYLGLWAVLILPAYLLYFVIKHMYEDEVHRHGRKKRMGV